MNVLLEKKIIEEINNPANVLVVDRRMNDEIFKFMRGSQTRIYLLNGVESGMWKLNIGDECLFDVNGDEKAFNTHPAKKSYCNILLACRGRYQRDLANNYRGAAYQNALSRMNAAERAVFDYLSR